MSIAIKLLLGWFCLCIPLASLGCEPGRTSEVESAVSYSIFSVSKSFHQDVWDPKTEKLRTRIRGQQESIAASMDMVILYDFETYFYDWKEEKGQMKQVITQLTANQGEVFTKTHNIIARGNVVITRENDLILWTNVVRYNDKDNEITTPPDSLVKVEYVNGATCSGYGMKTIRPTPGKDEKIEWEDSECQMKEDKEWRKKTE